MLSLGLTVNATLVDWGSLLKDCADPEAKCKSKNSCAKNKTGCAFLV